MTKDEIRFETNNLNKWDEKKRSEIIIAHNKEVNIRRHALVTACLDSGGHEMIQINKLNNRTGVNPKRCKHCGASVYDKTNISKSV